MSADDTRSPLCARVFDRLVEGAEVGDDLAEHLGSCMTCFRALTELRDAPRLVAVLRADPPSLPEDDRFWDELANRTTAAVAAARSGAAPATVRSGAAPATVQSGAAPATVQSAAPAVVRFRRRARVPAVVLATAVAAAAAFLLVPRRPEPISQVVGPKAPAGAEVVRVFSDDEPGEASDVGDLDRAALGRLLDRLRAGAPGALAASAGGDLADGSDALLDDESQVNDELAELDGPALLRVERSLGRTEL